FGAIEKTAMSPAELEAPDHKLIKDLVYAQDNLSERNLVESWHDLLQVKEESQKMFELGLLPLDVKAKTETLFWQIAKRMQKMASKLDPTEVPDDIADLKN